MATSKPESNLENFKWLLKASHLELHDLLEIVEQTFPDEKRPPNATYKPDIRLDRIKSDFRDWSTTRTDQFLEELAEDPEGSAWNRLAIPLSKAFREDERNWFRYRMGQGLVADSMATRELITLQVKARVLSDGDFGNNDSFVGKHLGTLTILGVGLVFTISNFSTGIQNGTIAPAIILSALIWVALGWFARKTYKRELEKLEEAKFITKNRLAEQRVSKSRMPVFFERNPWYLPTLEKFLAAVDLETENYLKELEVAVNKLKTEGPKVDGTKLHEDNFELDSTASSRVPNRMNKFDPAQYEMYCADWMSKLGAKNVALTPQGADGGIDIVSDLEVAQVKLYGKPISVQPVRELFGVSKSVSKTPIFFTSSGYTQAAMSFAEDNEVFLFIADPVSETLKGATPSSRSLLRTGLTLNNLDEDDPLSIQGNAHSGPKGYEGGSASDGYFER
jgi:hypothetical protein